MNYKYEWNINIHELLDLIEDLILKISENIRYVFYISYRSKNTVTYGCPEFPESIIERLRIDGYTSRKIWLKPNT